LVLYYPPEMSTKVGKEGFCNGFPSSSKTLFPSSSFYSS
jgi:hypothetical protein